jgi:hypothetical protein
MMIREDKGRGVNLSRTVSNTGANLITSDFDIPQWHKKMLDKRIKRAKNHPESMLVFDAVMKQLEK